MFDKKMFWQTIGVMYGSYALYKIIAVGLMWAIPNLEKKPAFEFIYLALVLAITVVLYAISNKLFRLKINIGVISFRSLWLGLGMIVALSIVWLDGLVALPESLGQGIYLTVASIAAALGAAIFEESRDRGFLINGFKKSLPDSNWKPVIVVVLTAVLFASTHFFNQFMPIHPTIQATEEQIFYTFAEGLALATLALRTGSILPGMIIHFLQDLAPWAPMGDLQATGWYIIVPTYSVIILFVIWALRPGAYDINMKYIRQVS